MSHLPHYWCPGVIAIFRPVATASRIGVLAAVLFFAGASALAAEDKDDRVRVAVGQVGTVGIGVSFPDGDREPGNVIETRWIGLAGYRKDNAQAVPRAFIRAVARKKYDNGSWRELKRDAIKVPSSGPVPVHFRLPAGLSSDRYALRFVAAPLAADHAKAPAGEAVINVLNPGGSVTLTLQAFRNVFLEGERPRLNAIIKTSAEIHGPLRLRLVGEHGEFIAKKKISGRLAPGTHTIVHTFDTSLFAPGHYVIDASIGSLSARGLKMEIVSRTRATDFVILEWTWGGGGMGTHYYIREMAASGFNLIGDLSNTYYDTQTDKATFKRYSNHPLLPAAEASIRLNKGAHLLEHLLRERISLLQEPPYFSALFRRLYHSVPEDETREAYRYSATTRQRYQIPSYLGNLYHEECFVRLGRRSLKAPWGDDPAQRASKDAIRNWLAWRQFDKESGGLAPAKMKVAEALYRGTMLSRHYEAWRRDQLKIDPGLMNGPNHGPIWGSGSGNHTPSIAAAVDFGFSHLYTDRGFAPFHGPQFVDIWRRNESPERYTPIWIAALSFGRRGDQREVAFQTLGRKVDGFGWNASSGGGGMVGASGLYHWSGVGRQYYHNTGRRERIDTINAINTRYGNLFLALERVKGVAVLCSFNQSVHDGPRNHRGIGRITESHMSVSMGAVYDLVRSHIQAHLVSGNRISEGALVQDNYRALALSRIRHPLPEPVAQGIRDFIANGGLVFGDEFTKPESIGIDGIHIVKDWRTEDIPLHIDGNKEHIIAYKTAMKHRKALRPFLAARLPSAVSCDDPRIMIAMQTWGDARYLFASNDTVPPYPWTAKSQAWLQQVFNYPVKRDISLAAQGVVYDVLEQKRLKIREEGGRFVFEGDFTRSEGKLYAVFPKVLAALRVSAPAKVVGGQNLVLSIAPLGPDGAPFSAPLPVEIRVVDPSARVRYHIYRCSSDVQKLKIAANDPAGTWTVQVKELVSGLVTDVAFDVASPRNGTWADALDPVGPTTMTNPRAVADFLREKDEIWIMLSKKQTRHEKLAQRLKRKLKRRGLKVKVKMFDLENFEKTPMHTHYTRAEWEHKEKLIRDKTLALRVTGGSFGQYFEAIISGAIGARPWDIYADVILLGNPGENRLLDALTPRWLVTKNLPGRGRGLIDLVPSAFTAGHDVVVVVAPDDAGLDAAVKSLIKLKKGKIPASVTYRLLPGKKAPPYTLADAGGDINAVTGKKAEPENFLEGRTGDIVGRIDISADGKSIAVFTDAFGYNVLLLDDAGKLVWRAKAGSLHALGELSDDGQWVIASAYIGGDTRGPGPGLHTNGFLDAENGAFGIEHPIYGRMQTGGSGPSHFLIDRSGAVVARSESIPALKKHAGIRDTATGPPRTFTSDLTLLQCVQEGKVLWEHDDYYVGLSYDELRFPAEFSKNIMSSPNGEYVTVFAYPKTQPMPYSGSRGPTAIERSKLMLFNVASGSVVWQKPGLVTGFVKVSDDGVTVFERKGDLVIADRTGRELTSFSVGGRILKMLKVGSRFAVLPGDRRRLIVNDVASGERAEIVPGSVIHDIAMSPDGKHVYLGTWDHRVHAFAFGGAAVWSAEVNGGAILEVTADGKHIIAGTNNGRVYSIAEDGRIEWDREITVDALEVIGKMGEIIEAQEKIPVVMAAGVDGAVVPEPGNDAPRKAWPEVKGKNIMPALVRADGVETRVLDPFGNLFARPAYFPSKVSVDKLGNGKIDDVKNALGGYWPNGRFTFVEIHIVLGEPRALTGFKMHGAAKSYFIQAWDMKEKKWHTLVRVSPVTGITGGHPLHKPYTTDKLRIGLPYNGHLSEIEVYEALDGEPAKGKPGGSTTEGTEGTEEGKGNNQ